MNLNSNHRGLFKIAPDQLLATSLTRQEWSRVLHSTITLAIFLVALTLSGCAGVTSAPLPAANANSSNPSSGTLATSATSVNFGNVPTASSNLQTLTLTNSGASSVTISQATVSGSGFSIVGGVFPTSIGAGQNRAFQIQFVPQSAGSVTGSIVVASDSANSPMSISLNGAGMTPLSISTQPVSQTSIAGQSVTFTVAAMGAGPLTYQWLKNGTPIIGATSSMYTTPATVVSDNGAQFAVTVATSAGSITSNAATLSVSTTTAAPTITTQPVSADVKAGQAATFSVTAAGTGPLSYQWIKNGLAISGATSSAYTTPPTTISDNRALFTVVASNSAGSATSNAATLNVAAATSISVAVSPASTSVRVGTTQQLAATIAGTSNTAVSWIVSGTGCSGIACGTISSGGLYTAPTNIPSPATVSVTATSVADTTKSASASVTVVAAVAVLLTLSPSSASVGSGGLQSFAAAVTGTSNTAVSWAVSGAGCSGSGCGTLSTSGLSAVYTGPLTAPSPASVKVVATSAADPSKSASAPITLVPGIVVTVSPSSASVATGKAQPFSAAVTGTSNAAAKWSLQGTGCSGSACGTIDSNGVYTAPPSLPSPASVSIIAASVADPLKTNSALVAIVPAASSPNPANSLNISTTHPRLFWNADRLAKAQSWWGTNSYTPEPSNKSPFDPYDTLLACQMSNNQSWCDAQINWAVNLSQSGCYKSVGCDSMRVYGEAVMLTYDWLYARMTAAQRTTIINNWNTWLGYLDTSNDWGNTGMPSSNYFAGAFRTDFSMGIATLGDNSQSSTFLNYALNNRWGAVVNFSSPAGTGPLAGKGYGMPHQEGSQYGRYSLAYYAVPLVTSALMGRDLGQETTAFKAGVLDTIYNTMPTKTTSRGIYDGFTWSDDENWVAGGGLYGGGGMQSRYYGDFMMAAAQQFSGTSVGKLARQWITTVNPNIGPMWMAVDPGGSGQAFSTLPLDYYASGPQFAFWRNSWNSNASALFLQMGQTFGVGHNHFDVGNFQWFRGGSYLIRETPTYEESIAGYNSSGVVDGSAGYGHNVPLIGGLPGVIAGCTDSNGIVRRMETQPGYAYMDTDISGSYSNNTCAGNHPERENAYAKHVEREFIFFRDIEVLLVLDRLEADTASRGRTFISHCENNPSVVDASHYVCVDGNQQANYSVLLPATRALKVVNEASNGATCAKNACQYRLEINDNTPIGAQSYFLVAIQGLNAGGTPVSPRVQDNGSSWTITLDANHTATLNKGMNSSGGSVTINGTTTNLRSDVQSMTITDNGPVW